MCYYYYCYILLDVTIYYSILLYITIVLYITPYYYILRYITIYYYIYIFLCVTIYIERERVRFHHGIDSTVVVWPNTLYIYICITIYYYLYYIWRFVRKIDTWKLLSIWETSNVVMEHLPGLMFRLESYPNNPNIRPFITFPIGITSF